MNECFVWVYFFSGYFMKISDEVKCYMLCTNNSESIRKKNGLYKEITNRAAIYIRRSYIKKENRLRQTEQWTGNVLFSIENINSIDHLTCLRSKMKLKVSIKKFSLVFPASHWLYWSQRRSRLWWWRWCNFLRCWYEFRLRNWLSCFANDSFFISGCIKCSF